MTDGTTAEQAEAIPALVKDIVQASERLRFDRAHFKKFGDSSLDYEVVYIVLDPAFTLSMDEKQRTNPGPRALSAVLPPEEHLCAEVSIPLFT